MPFFLGVLSWVGTNQQEVKMFNVSDRAGEMMKEYFTGREETASVRIMLNEGG